MGRKAKPQIDVVREAAETSLSTFIKLVAPHRVLGQIHQDVIHWWTREDAKDHQLLLLPRDHQKSVLIAYRVAWELTRDPTLSVLYISSTSGLAEKQLRFIKNIFTSPIYRRYWPEMTNPDEGKRAKWTNTEIILDHPKRTAAGVGDPSIFTAGLTTSITGFHCNIAVLDDVVVQENAYTKEGREKVKTQYSLLASIETTGAREWVVGTRYHPMDLYNDMLEMVEEQYDDGGNLVSQTQIYEIFQREVEDRGDGTGDYLWPRQQRADGKWFGFNQQILAQKRGKYLDRAQFRAQYYNNPNDPENEAIDSNLFQYYDAKYLRQSDGRWFFRDRPLNVFAAIDFAFSLRATADYSSLAVIGIDPDNNIYVLEIVRFKTNKISEYFDKILRAYMRWGFRKIRAEVTVAQEIIVEDLKRLIREEGIALSVDSYRPLRKEGTKEERIAATLNPRYENHQIFHYQGGSIYELEMELRDRKPKHDDMKDALCNAISIALPPRGATRRARSNVVYNPRFGGVAA